MLILLADDLRALVPMPDAIAAVRAAFVALSSGRATVPVCTAPQVAGSDATFLTMPVLVPAGRRHRGHLRGRGPGPDATGDRLCRVVRHADSYRGSHPRPRRGVRGVGAGTGLVRGATVVIAADPSLAVRAADIVVTATTSSTPVFPGRAVGPGTHVNAIGAFQPHTREVDSEVVARAAVFVDSRSAALAEAGDLLIPIQEDGGRQRRSRSSSPWATPFRTWPSPDSRSAAPGRPGAGCASNWHDRVRLGGSWRQSANELSCHRPPRG